jgi:hypothetical protein
MSVFPQNRLRHLITAGNISLHIAATTRVIINGETEVLLLLSAQECLKLCRTPKLTPTFQTIRTDLIAIVLHRQGEMIICLHAEKTITEGLISHHP